jgi:phosphoribosyl 1,2-cyclic phosphate phosphodiesterase
MKIEFLGTGGAVTIPQPSCECAVCEQARSAGLPYTRTGPSLFVHDASFLIDTPEEIKEQLNRAAIRRVQACAYSHWHPDHVMGRRVWEMNKDWLNLPPQDRCTDIYLPPRVAADFRRFLGSWDHFAYFQQLGLVRIVELAEGESFTLPAHGPSAQGSPLRVTPIPLAESYVYAFLLEQDNKRVLIAMDELFGWTPPDDLPPLDLAILPMGLAEVHPLTGAQLIAAEHPVLKMEATYEQTLAIVRALDAKQTLLTHIEEPVGLSYDDLLEIEAQVQADGLPIRFAYDGLIVEA